MSLILEALKKLDREKEAPDRGFLILAPATWPSRGAGRLPLVMSLLALGLASGGLVAGLWLAQARSAQRAMMAPATPPAMAPAALPGPAGPPRVPALAPGAARSARPPAAEPADKTDLPESPRTERPPAAATPAPPPEARYVLQAISQKDGRPVAVLNDRLVREGDSFDGVSILRIGETEVEIEVDGRRQVVRF